MEGLKNFLFVLLGIIVAVTIFCAVVGIASVINDVSFEQQIVNWFTSSETTELVEEVTDTVASKILF